MNLRGPSSRCSFNVVEPPPSKDKGGPAGSKRLVRQVDVVAVRFFAPPRAWELEGKTDFEVTSRSAFPALKRLCRFWGYMTCTCISCECFSSSLR